MCSEVSAVTKVQSFQPASPAGFFLPALSRKQWILLTFLTVGTIALPETCDRRKRPQMGLAFALQSFFSSLRVINGSASSHGVKWSAARSRAEDPRRNSRYRALVPARMAGAHAAVLLLGRPAQRRLQARPCRYEPVSRRIQRAAGRSAASRGSGCDGVDRKNLPGREEPARHSRAAHAQCVLPRKRRATRHDHAAGGTERALRHARRIDSRSRHHRAVRRAEDRARTARALAAPAWPEELRSVLDPD